MSPMNHVFVSTFSHTFVWVALPEGPTQPLPPSGGPFRKGRTYYENTLSREWVGGPSGRAFRHCDAILTADKGKSKTTKEMLDTWTQHIGIQSLYFDCSYSLFLVVLCSQVFGGRARQQLVRIRGRFSNTRWGGAGRHRLCHSQGNVSPRRGARKQPGQACCYTQHKIKEKAWSPQIR